MWQKFCRALLIAVCGAALGATSLYAYEQRRCGDSHFLRREYACSAQRGGPGTFLRLENEVRSRIAKGQATSTLTRSGVYFQRLRDGAGFRINDDALFAPASMLKLPVVVWAFLLEAQHPGTLLEKVPYSPERAQHFDIPAQIEVADAGLVVGQSYTVEELMRATIAHSDNLAYFSLLAHLNDSPERNAHLLRTLRELGIQDPKDNHDPAASVREYAALLRSLYNATYLDAESSEKLLSWLSRSTYDKGIAAGTPKGVEVANKFGERQMDGGVSELHDCGIVYENEDPYVLCVMTEGRSFADLQAVISDISSTVYTSTSQAR